VPGGCCCCGCVGSRVIRVGASCSLSFGIINIGTFVDGIEEVLEVGEEVTLGSSLFDCN